MHDATYKRMVGSGNFPCSMRQLCEQLSFLSPFLRGLILQNVFRSVLIGILSLVKSIICLVVKRLGHRGPMNKDAHPEKPTIFEIRSVIPILWHCLRHQITNLIIFHVV